MRLIVNADDLGKSTLVNQMVFDLMSRKRVTSATMFANGPASGAAIRELSHFPGCSFGIHLNVSEFMPVSQGTGLSSILDEAGQFNGVLNQNPGSVKTGAAFVQAVVKECCAQMDKILAAGVRISHIDSHHHIHTLPFMFPIIKYLQVRYKIRKVRIAKNVFRSGELVSSGMQVKRKLYNAALRTIYRTRTTAAFTDLMTLYENARFGVRIQESVEVMVHPGQQVDNGEGELLDSDWHEALPFNVQNISYNEL